MARTSDSVHPALRAIGVLGNLGGIIFPVGLVALLCVPGVLFYQAKRWLEVGRWPAVSVADGLQWVNLPQPHFASRTLQTASEQLMVWPLSLVLLFGIGGLLFAYARFSKWLEKYCEPEKAEFAAAD